MANNKFYAVRVGRNTGIFNTWDECQKNVTGFKGAVYKSFLTIEEANDFLGGTENIDKFKSKKISGIKEEKLEENEIDKDLIRENLIKPVRSKASVEVFTSYIACEEVKDKYDFIAFVDGSYDRLNKIYGSGVVVLNLNDDEYKCYSTAGYDKWDQWNIVGELEATKLALRIAKEEYKAKNIAIYHDLKNISLWASGEWQAKNEYTQDYVKEIEKFSEKLNITFIKVKAHSTESRYNDIADESAKNSIKEYLCANNIDIPKEKTKKSKKISVNISPELIDDFKRKCEKLNLSNEEVINNLIKEWIES